MSTAGCVARAHGERRVRHCYDTAVGFPRHFVIGEGFCVLQRCFPTQQDTGYEHDNSLVAATILRIMAILWYICERSVASYGILKHSHGDLHFRGGECTRLTLKELYPSPCDGSRLSCSCSQQLKEGEDMSI